MDAKPLAASFLILLLAGCSAAPASLQEITVQSQPGDPRPPASQTITVADPGQDWAGGGYLEGYVVDAAIRPLSGATITATGAGLTVLTGPGGQFKLGPLGEGSYFVTAHAQGFQDAQAVAYIGEGAGKIKFVLEALASSQPRHTTQHWRGLADYTVPDTNSTGLGPPGVTCDSCFFDIEFDPSAQVFIVEATMAPYSYGQPGGNGFMWRRAPESPEDDRFMPNPLRFEAPRAEYNGTVQIGIMPTSSPLVEFSKAFDVYVTSWFNSVPPPNWSIVAGDE